ncbi:hypothetical protein QYF36_010289 [Acer negundo]|nr:hypothetical protein QYF36_010289 [Acer negundo]
MRIFRSSKITRKNNSKRVKRVNHIMEDKEVTKYINPLTVSIENVTLNATVETGLETAKMQMQLKQVVQVMIWRVSRAVKQMTINMKLRYKNCRSKNELVCSRKSLQS